MPRLPKLARQESGDKRPTFGLSHPTQTQPVNIYQSSTLLATGRPRDSGRPPKRPPARISAKKRPFKLQPVRVTSRPATRRLRITSCPSHPQGSGSDQPTNIRGTTVTCRHTSQDGCQPLPEGPTNSCPRDATNISSVFTKQH